jgi:RNA polymerase sigma-70 factor (ECF subfamily)
MESYTPSGDNSSCPEASEEALIRRTIAGDTEAFGDLYERHLPVLFRYIRCRIQDTREAEDLAETVFLRVWESLSTFQVGRISFRSWLFRLARNLLIDRYRIRKEEHPLAGIPVPADRAPLPEDQVIAQQQRDRILEAVAALKREYQDVLALRFLAGLPHQEVAEVMGKSEAAVRVLQHRALRALLQRLRKSE